jgi:hypothetical protein
MKVLSDRTSSTSRNVSPYGEKNRRFRSGDVLRSDDAP